MNGDIALTMRQIPENSKKHNTSLKYYEEKKVCNTKDKNNNCYSNNNTVIISFIQYVKIKQIILKL